eukprot:GILK01009970.1.p1 GENE.GILK01009970.1~~GILK01009970.1.p1  ORF type:complete len:1047 (+),score=116.75 GILK01009970.1:38-3142(+)
METAFKCFLCNDVLLDAVEGKCCTTLFCRPCAEEHAAQDNLCPSCKKPNFSANFTVNLSIQKVMSRLPAQCKFAVFGCKEEVTLAQKRRHESECSFRQVKCPFSDLCGVLSLSELAVHRNVCPHRSITCQCGTTMAMNEFDQHQLTCDVCRVPCDYCGVQIERQTMAEHFEHSCPQIQIPCPNQDSVTGKQCDVSVPRCQLDAHREECDYRTAVCPHPECGATFTANRLQNHLKTCNYETICCFYKQFGCAATFLRGRESDHMTEATSSHLEFVTKEVLRLQEMFSDLQKERSLASAAACIHEPDPHAAADDLNNFIVPVGNTASSAETIRGNPSSSIRGTPDVVHLLLSSNTSKAKSPARLQQAGIADHLMDVEVYEKPFSEQVMRQQHAALPAAARKKDPGWIFGSDTLSQQSLKQFQDSQMQSRASHSLNIMAPPARAQSSSNSNNPPRVDLSQQRPPLVETPPRVAGSFDNYNSQQFPSTAENAHTHAPTAQVEDGRRTKQSPSALKSFDETNRAMEGGSFSRQHVRFHMDPIVVKSSHSDDEESDRELGAIMDNDTSVLYPDADRGAAVTAEDELSFEGGSRSTHFGSQLSNMGSEEDRREYVKGLLQRGRELCESNDSDNFLRAMELFTDIIGHSMVAKDQLAVAYCNRAHCLLRLKRFQLAAADADMAIQLAPHWHKGYLTRGAAALAMRDELDALHFYEKSRAIEPDNSRVLAAIERVKSILRRKGNRSQAHLTSTNGPRHNNDDSPTRGSEVSGGTSERKRRRDNAEGASHPVEKRSKSSSSNGRALNRFPVIAKSDMNRFFGEDNMMFARQLVDAGNVSSVRMEGFATALGQCLGHKEEPEQAVITFSGDRISSASCTCPVGLSSPCKHAAAVLLALCANSSSIARSSDLSNLVSDASVSTPNELREGPLMRRDTSDLDQTHLAEMYREKLAHFTIPQLKAMLKLNDQVLGGTKDVLLDRVVDGMVNGALPRCPSCRLGHLRYNKLDEVYTCPGYHEGPEAGVKCGFTAKDIERNPWKGMSHII